MTPRTTSEIADRLTRYRRAISACVGRGSDAHSRRAFSAFRAVSFAVDGGRPCGSVDVEAQSVPARLVHPLAVAERADEVPALDTVDVRERRTPSGPRPFVRG